MTRAHAARQLLKHGPLTLSEFVSITGWKYAQCRRVLSYLVDRLGEVSRTGGGYKLSNTQIVGGTSDASKQL